ncbi:response regulator [Oscillatoria sp. FACHB-1406]|uniref:response regulator n=1 Tax=Oscillatoria sp. FACHB-1406 TaxID=2692846 RepID=UPI0016832717|nr:response regulator [Oscillatoria sp. FACHB-1406]MBD2576836.1 response regulator [Oscillatoria sp. FACHB-1406]
MSKPVILCVDDEQTILKSLKAQIKGYFGDTYNYEVAENADDALELVEELVEENVKIVIVVSDWLMPGMKGDELLIEIHKKFPNIVTVMLTGQADKTAVERAYELANLHGCLRKPWSDEDLLSLLKSALAMT